MEDKPSTHRSGLFIATLQTQSLCQSIRFAIQTGNKVGPSTIAVLNDLREGLVAAADGPPIRRLPEVSDGLSDADILAVAEILHATFLAFLSPEEAEEQRGVMGFHARNR